ncbi:MAG: nucleotidyltransferase domain-containing protein [Candidatus Aenigmarchaeota archaeon]|nr:nucleotidyltransferase domain-containing protein [Candidatus Aenigmarchaeota archaeon]MDI6722010.1 nucleotidyltransferase domain-containing protein [Candidatus Aenigmarchaeota archaeon]
MIEKYALFRAIDGLRDQNEYSIRGLAKKTGIGIATAKVCLDYLFSKDMVKRKIVGKSHIYSFDTANYLTRYTKILFSLIEINDSSIVKEIVARYPVNSIVLYGSAARGEDDTKSDIDILVISRKKISMPLKSEKNLKREVTLLIYTLPEWRRKSKEDKVFYDRIIIDGIPLYGDIPIVS